MARLTFMSGARRDARDDALRAAVEDFQSHAMPCRPPPELRHQEMRQGQTALVNSARSGALPDRGNKKGGRKPCRLLYSYWLK